MIQLLLFFLFSGGLLGYILHRCRPGRSLAFVSLVGAAIAPGVLLLLTASVWVKAIGTPAAQCNDACVGAELAARVSAMVIGGGLLAVWLFAFLLLRLLASR